MARNIKEWIYYNPDTGNLRWLQSPRYEIPVGALVGWKDRKGYIRFKFDGENYSAHREIFNLMGLPVPDQVDHKNGTRSDNRWVNLRPATGQLNAYNKKRQTNNTLGVKGVTLRPDGKYRARCTANGLRVSLGDWDTLEGAERSLMVFRDIYHGEFANGG